MALALYNRVQQTGTANTTVSFTLSGTVSGFQSFSVIGNGNTTYYSATDASGNWEVGLGTYSTTGPTLTRTTVYSSSNAGAAVTFSGDVNVFVTQPAENTVVSSNNSGTSGQVLTSQGTGVAPIWATAAGGGAFAVCNTSNIVSCISGNGGTGTNNFFAGYLAGNDSTTGGFNTFIGRFAGRANTSGTNNFFGGYHAGCANTTGTYNTFIGRFAGRSNDTGNNNIFFGFGAGCSNTSGSFNTFIGNSAGRYNTTGTNNFFVGGPFAGCKNTTGSHNTFIGSCAGRCNTTGSNNTFFGFQAGCSNTSGSFNNFFGYHSGRANTTGCHNNFFGLEAGRYNTTGINNTFFGNNAGRPNTTGSNNTFIGRYAGRFNTSGCHNNFFGFYAGRSNDTGSHNNFIGCCAGYPNTTGSNNLAFGCNSGNDAVFTMGTTDNRIVMGNNNHTNAYIKVAWTVTSDARDKTNIIAIPSNRALFAGLKPVQYNWMNRATGKVTDDQPRYGFLAQDIAELESDPRILIDDTDPNNLKLRETMMIPIIVGEVQAMNAEISELRAELQEVKRRIN